MRVVGEFKEVEKIDDDDDDDLRDGAVVVVAVSLLALVRMLSLLSVDVSLAASVASPTDSTTTGIGSTVSLVHGEQSTDIRRRPNGDRHAITITDCSSSSNLSWWLLLLLRLIDVGVVG